MSGRTQKRDNFHSTLSSTHQSGVSEQYRDVEPSRSGRADLFHHIQLPLCLQCYFWGAAEHADANKHTRVRSHIQVTTGAHVCTGTRSLNVTLGAVTHTHMSLQMLFWTRPSFCRSQTAQSVYPCLDKYTLAGGGVYFT